jgi:hypothetical protein
MVPRNNGKGVIASGAICAANPPRTPASPLHRPSGGPPPPRRCVMRGRMKMRRAAFHSSPDGAGGPLSPAERSGVGGVPPAGRWRGPTCTNLAEFYRVLASASLCGYDNAYAEVPRQAAPRNDETAVIARGARRAATPACPYREPCPRVREGFGANRASQ